MRLSPFVLAPLAACVLLAGHSAGATEWDQERVTVLAREMLEPLNIIRTGLGSRPPIEGREEAHAALVDKIEVLYSRTRQLVEDLETGSGQAETAALFREIAAAEREAVRLTRDYPARFEMHVHIDRFRSILAQLATFYGESGKSARSPTEAIAAIE
jgi:hypothetical protein